MIRRLFRKYHRQLAIILSLPILLTVLTGLGYTIANEWFHLDDFGDFLLDIHTMKIIHLDGIYPVLNGIGLIGLLVTGLSMTGLFPRKSPARDN